MMLSLTTCSFKRQFYSLAGRLSYSTLPYNKIHVPVMLQEVLTYLQPKDGGIYCDMTFGDGGYTKAILGTLSLQFISFHLIPNRFM